MRLIFLLMLVAACGAAPTAGPSFPKEALTTVTGSSKQLNVEIRSSPQPPTRGQSSFQFTITDTNGHPVEGLQLAVQPWMPQMGHGTAVVPTVKEIGGGVYQITDVYLFMAGVWELRTTFNGSLTDSVAPQFQIQ